MVRGGWVVRLVHRRMSVCMSPDGPWQGRPPVVAAVALLRRYSYCLCPWPCAGAGDDGGRCHLNSSSIRSLLRKHVTITGLAGSVRVNTTSSRERAHLPTGTGIPA